MVRGLSPLVRLDEMHPTLAKFSIPKGGERGGGGGGAAEAEDGRAGSSPSGLSLSKAFEVIEASKDELEVFICDFVVIPLFGLGLRLRHLACIYADWMLLIVLFCFVVRVLRVFCLGKGGCL